jgi:hypothetical protein
MRRLVLVPVMALALVSGIHGTAAAAPPANRSVSALDIAAESTMLRAEQAISFIVEAQEANQISYTSSITATATRYDETVTLANGTAGRIGVSPTLGYVTASLIPLPQQVLTEARLGPSSVVTFIPGKTPLGKLVDIAVAPNRKQQEYLDYSPAGMWLRIAEQAQAGQISLGNPTTTTIPNGSTRYRVAVTEPGNPTNAYIFTGDIAAGNTLVRAELDAGEDYRYSISIQGLGDAVTFAEPPARMRPWSDIQAAQWRLVQQPRASAAARTAKTRVEKTAQQAGRPPSVSEIRSAARLTAADIKIRDAKVRAWDIAGGARIEVTRTGEKGWRWTVGACITVKSDKVIVAAC